MKNVRFKLNINSILLPVLLLSLSACGPLDNSDVGKQEDFPPVAKALAIGLGADNSTREGSEIILTGKDSSGQDTPIFEFEWSNSSSNPLLVQLRELTANSVSFKAPQVTEETDFTFELLVTDAEGAQATDSVTLTVIPARDLNRFLSFDSLVASSLESYEVALNPTNNQAVNASNSDYTLNVNVVIHYPDQSAICATDGFDTSGETCLTYVNNNTRALSQYTQQLNGIWQSNDANIATETKVTLPLPQIIVDQFNQELLNDGASREALLDLWKADDIEIELTFDLTSDILADLSVLGPNNGNPVNLNPVRVNSTNNTQNNIALQISSMASPVTVTVEEIRNSGMGRIESKATAQAYYNAIDPTNSADTLNKWLVNAGFAQDNGDGSISLIPEAANGVDSNDSEFAHAVYTNNFDLGFGRDMYVRVDEDGNVYSYVVNYPTLEAAIKKLNPLATVVMEYSPPAQGVSTDEKFVKFYTFIPNEQGEQVRTTDFNFDGRGQKYLPGVCAACHGGEPKAIDDSDPTYLGDIGSAFLPWDLDSFLYSDTDPAILDISEVETDTSNLAYSQANQEDQLRKLNQAVYHTYKLSSNPRFDNAIDLIGGSNGSPGWYNDEACPEGSNTVACISGNFNGEYVPDAWAAERELYTDVVARHCRSCHVGREGTDQDPNFLQMATPDDLLSPGNRDKTIELVFEKGVMPLARLTMDRFWTGTDSNLDPTSLLWERLGEVSNTPTPGAPLPSVSSRPIEFYSVDRSLNDQSYLLTKVGRNIVIDASASLFTDSFEWTLLDSTNVVGFESCLNDSQALTSTGAQATLSPTLATASNQFYCIQMTAVNDLASVAADIVFVQAVNNRDPEIIFSSNCGANINECLSVSELNSDPSSSAISLSGSSDTDPLDFTNPNCTPDANTVCTNINTLLQITDQDVNDNLDPDSIITLELARTPSRGTFLPTTFNLQELLSGNVVSFETSEDEVGANPVTQVLEFNVYDNGVLVNGLSINSAEININPVSDNNPVFGTVNDTVVSFGATSSTSSFDITDNDLDTITLSATTSPLGTINLSQPATNGAVTSYDYSFTAKTATELAGTGSICSGVESFRNGANTSSFQLSADDGSQNVGLPVTRNVDITLTADPSLTYLNVAQAYSNKITDGNKQCFECHPAQAGPNWITDISIMRQNINFGAPKQSLIFTKGNGINGHVGGTFSVNFNNTAELNLLEWINQCAPD